MSSPARSGPNAGLFPGPSIGFLLGLIFFLPTAHAEDSDLGSSGSLEPPTTESASLTPQPADRQLLDEVMRDGAVLTETPRPKVTQYVGDVVSGTMERLVSWLFGSRSVDETAFKIVQWMIITLVAALTVMLLYQWFRWWRRRSKEPVPMRPEVLHIQSAPEKDWQSELEKRLADGEAAAALEALWWWLAKRLDVEQADASWTTRELARRAGRRDLMPQVRRWDHLVYGGGAVDTESVRGLWQDLRESLA